jgi:hypothetical protein
VTAVSVPRRCVLFPNCLFCISCQPLCPCDFRSRSLGDLFFGLICCVRFRERNNIVDRICRVRIADPEVEQTWSTEDFQVLDWSNLCVIPVRLLWSDNSVNFCQHFASQIHELHSSPSRVITSIEEKVSNRARKRTQGTHLCIQMASPIVLS